VWVDKWGGVWFYFAFEGYAQNDKEQCGQQIFASSFKVFTRIEG